MSTQNPSFDTKAPVGTEMKTSAGGAKGRRVEQHLARLVPSLLFIVGMLSLTGCELVGSIFKAGLWVGIAAVLGLVVLIGGVVAIIRR